MDRKIRVGAVSYLNTKPLIYGLEKGLMKEDLMLELDYPAKIAAKLLNDEIDIGLVPVAIIPQMKEYHIISNYGICANGPVASVALFSETPLPEIREVLMDYQSRTSVRLASILMKEHWKINPLTTDTDKDFRYRIQGDTAGVVIGDRALEQRTRSAYNYDLGEAWKEFTGLPFVFAAWVSNKMIDEGLIARFNEANAYGLLHLNDIIIENVYTTYSLDTYYNTNIDFELNAEKRTGLNLFLKMIGE